MTEAIFVVLGGAIGGAVAIRWLVQSPSRWVVVARVSAVCALMGAFVALIPNPSGAVAAFVGPGLLSTLATSAAFMMPLPRLRQSSDVWRFAKSMSVSLTIMTYFGLLFALLGNMAVQAAWHLTV